MTVDKNQFNLQYNTSYITRYNQMKELILNNAALKEYELPVKKLSDLDENECITISILFLKSSLKPSILKPENKNSRFYLNEDSEFYLEDSTGRIRIIFDENFEKLNFFMTGLVLGFVGFKNSKNMFVCTDIIYPKSINSLSNEISGKSILFLSNININVSNFEKLKFILNYYSGNVSDVVIFGPIAKNLDDFDVILNDINIRVHLVPGYGDYTSCLLPQEPFNNMLFNNGNINRLTNPGEAFINGKLFRFVNNQIIKEGLRYSDGKNMNEHSLIKQLVKCRLFAPFCPDTLGSIPFVGNDPFIINDCDYLVFGGTKENFIFQDNVNVLAIKDFMIDDSCLLLDLEKNEINEIRLNLFN